MQEEPAPTSTGIIDRFKFRRSLQGFTPTSLMEAAVLASL